MPFLRQNLDRVLKKMHVRGMTDIYKDIHLDSEPWIRVQEFRQPSNISHRSNRGWTSFSRSNADNAPAIEAILQDLYLIICGAVFRKAVTKIVRFKQ